MGDAGDEIRRLMARGLDLYALGSVSEAIDCWRRVLSLDPSHAEARDYLQAAGGEPEPAAAARGAPGEAAPRAPAKPAPSGQAAPPAPTAPRAAALTAEAVKLIRAGKPGEALELLETQTRKEPGDLDAQAFQELARAALLRSYRARTGSGEQVPSVRIAPNEMMKYNLPAAAGFLLSMIDGRMSIDELLSVSGMDPFEALRAFHSLLDAGIVEARVVEARPVNRAERSLLSFLDAPVVVGDPEGRAVYVNPAFESRFEVDPDGAAGHPLAELFSGGSREAVLRAVAEVCERGESVRVSLRERGAGFSAVISPIVADSARVGVVILLREEMEGVERMLAIHREIADPLDELESTLQVLHEQTGGRRAQRYRADVEDGLRALARLKKWTDELRATLAGRAGAGNQEASFEPAQLVRAVARRLRARAGAAHADLAFLAPAALPRVRGDSPKLEAILLRLVLERVALDPAPETLTLSARQVGRPPDGAVLITLSETFRLGSAPPEVREPPLVREVLGACGGSLHVTCDPQIGRATLLHIPLAEV